LSYTLPVVSRIQVAINAYPKPVAKGLLALRRIILSTARETPGVGAIEEDLRWGQPSFLTAESGSGSTIRIGGYRGDSSRYAMYFYCQSGLLFRTLYGAELTLIGKRAIEFRCGEPLPKSALKHCIRLALTHHLRKKRTAPRAAKQPPR
jgi:hypothetical protein